MNFPDEMPFLSAIKSDRFYVNRINRRAYRPGAGGVIVGVTRIVPPGDGGVDVINPGGVDVKSPGGVDVINPGGVDVTSPGGVDVTCGNGLGAVAVGGADGVLVGRVGGSSSG